VRAELTADGKLTVRAETPLEAYALSCWQAGQARRKGRTTLEIDASVAQPLVCPEVTRERLVGYPGPAFGECQ
jgi:hypothetical protein